MEAHRHGAPLARQGRSAQDHIEADMLAIQRNPGLCQVVLPCSICSLYY